MWKMLIFVAGFVATGARADEPRWWLMDGADAVFPVGARELPAVAKDGGTTFAFAVRNDRDFSVKCDFEALIDESDGDDVLTETVPLDGKVIRAGHGYTLHAAIADEDLPDGYHLVLGSQRLVGTCLGLAEGVTPAEAPAPRSSCAEDKGCTTTCQASATEPKACASPHGGWGEGRFLVPGEGSKDGPEAALDLYASGAGTGAAVYLGPRAGPRVCAGSLVARYEKGGEQAADRRPVERKLLRAGRTAVVTGTVGGALAAAGWQLAGGDLEVFCAPYAGEGAPLPDPEAAYRNGEAGAERLAAPAGIFTIAR